MSGERRGDYGWQDRRPGDDRRRRLPGHDYNYAVSNNRSMIPTDLAPRPGTFFPCPHCDTAARPSAVGPVNAGMGKRKDRKVYRTWVCNGCGLGFMTVETLYAEIVPIGGADDREAEATQAGAQDHGGDRDRNRMGAGHKRGVVGAGLRHGGAGAAVGGGVRRRAAD